jgi:hypothetical protein
VLRLQQANNPLARREPGNITGIGMTETKPLRMVRTRVSGSTLILCGSGSRVFDDQKIAKHLQLKNLYFLKKKIAIYFSLGLHKGRLIYRRSLQPFERERKSRTSKREISLLFLFFWGDS